MERTFLVEQGQAGPDGRSRIEDLSFQIGELEKRLDSVERQCKTELNTARENLAHTEQKAATLQEEMVIKYRELYGLVQKVRNQIEEPRILKRYRQMDKMVNIAVRPRS